MKLSLEEARKRVTPRELRRKAGLATFARWWKTQRASTRPTRSGWMYSDHDVESYARRARLAGRRSAKSEERKP